MGVMLRRSTRWLGGGHGDAFPTSKAAAHLDFKWVMSRSPRPAPPPGFCDVEYAHPPAPPKFSFTSPVVCSEGQIPVKVDGVPRGCVTQRPSPATIDCLVHGTYLELAFQSSSSDETSETSFSSSSSSLGHVLPRRSGVAMANIVEKARSEERMKNRRYDEFQRPVRYAPHMVPTTDIMVCQEYVDIRVNDIGKRVVDSNRLGYQPEYVPWNLSPPGTRQPTEPAAKPTK